jgi:uncharacterized protein YybS (DUF2232 family)
MNNNVKALTQGALMVALMGVFLVINRQSGELLEFYAAFLLPLPIIVYASQYGGKASIIPLISITMLSLMIGVPTSVFTVLHASITGVLYGDSVYTHRSDRYLLSVITIATTLYYIFTTWILAGLFGVDLQMEATSIINFLQSQGFKAVLGMSLTQMVVYLIPNIVIFTAIMQSLLVHILARVLLNRLHIVLMPQVKLSDMIPPKFITWPLLGILIITSVVNVVKLDIPFIDIMNFLTITGLLVFIIYGLLFLVVWISANGWRILTLLVYVLLFILPFIMLPLLIVIGVVGLCFRFNRIDIVRSQV